VHAVRLRRDDHGVPDEVQHGRAMHDGRLLQRRPVRSQARDQGELHGQRSVRQRQLRVGIVLGYRGKRSRLHGG
jgi:hypothetical protein